MAAEFFTDFLIELWETFQLNFRRTVFCKIRDFLINADVYLQKNNNCNHTKEMASIKIKIRPSSILDKEGAIYYQIIHDRTPRQVLTDYHIFPSEWDYGNGDIKYIKNSDRSPIMIKKDGFKRH